MDEEAGWRSQSFHIEGMGESRCRGILNWTGFGFVPRESKLGEAS